MTSTDTSLRFRLRRNLGRSQPIESPEATPAPAPDTTHAGADPLPPLLLTEDARVYPSPSANGPEETGITDSNLMPPPEPSLDRPAGTFGPLTPSDNTDGLRSGPVSEAEVAASPPVLPPDQQTGELAEPELAAERGQVRQRGGIQLSSFLAGLLLFVAMPTALAGWYFQEVATPFYATESQFFVARPDVRTDSAARGAADQTVQTDAAALQGMLQSRAAMLRLVEEEGFAAHFQQDNLDPVRRLRSDASAEDMFRSYSRHVMIDRDPAHGVLRLEVLAATPADSTRFAESLISFAQEHLGAVDVSVREAQITTAMTALEDAQTRLIAARKARAEAAGPALVAAQTEVETWEALRAQAIETLESERRQMRREARHLVVTVPPVAPEAAVTPRPLEYTALAFALFLALFVLAGSAVALLRTLLAR